MNFDEMEKAKREQLGKIRDFSPLEFDPERWEKLRKIVYKPHPLNLDVIIDDTTLREGLQMAGLVSPRSADTCRIACMLRDTGVERLEVLTYTNSDQEAIKLMQDEGLEKMLAAWCRATRADIDLALKFDFKQVGVSHPVSYIHFEKWTDKSLQELIERVVDTVAYAVEHGLTVFVHGEDSTRADWKFERAFINAVADAGASVYRICDTIGCGLSDPSASLPNGIPAKIRQIKEDTKIPNVEIHAHDDFGNAVENTMAAIRAASGLFGKVYASTTFLGIGDRAGNAETEKIILNCYMHYDIKKWNLQPLRELATFLASSLKYQLPLNKAIVGDAAFAHESGIHIHGLMALPLTYEPFPPELVGQKRTIVVGKRSGKHGVRLKLEELTGQKIDEDDPRLAEIVELLKNKFVTGERRYPIRDDEFKQYAQKAGFKIE
ncbi:MAG: LeuA family protein [Candidatus Hadarchaeaceae archaeon]